MSRGNKRTPRARRRWAFWKLIRLLLLWRVLPDRYKAGVMRACTAAVDLERVQAGERVLDAASWAAEDPSGDWREDDRREAELCAAVEALEKLDAGGQDQKSTDTTTDDTSTR